MSDASRDFTPPRTSQAQYAKRRQRLAARLGDVAVVLPGGQVVTRSNDTDFRFRPDSDFHYLTGLEEPDGVLVFRPQREPALTLFMRPKDPEAEVWTGRRVGAKGAVDDYGADEAHDLSALGAKLPELLDGIEQVHVPFDRAPGLRKRVHDAITRLHRLSRSGKTPPTALVDTRGVLAEERLIKDPAALASLRAAVELTVKGHAEAAARLAPGMPEYAFEAQLEYCYRRHGSSGPGYGNIVGSGDNATILHYVDNRDTMRDGEVLLVDSGAEWEYFSGDLTRCYPVGGRFSPAQRALYQVVLAANERGVSMCTRGGDIESIHRACVEILCEGLIDLGLVEGKLDEVVEGQDYKRFYMHRTSHWLGVDVHDVGTYSVAREPRRFEPGHVLTVEPGLYVSAAYDDVPEEFRGIGIRIEDDVLVTDGPPEVLTAGAPKAIDEVEAMVGVGVGVGTAAQGSTRRR